MLRTPNSLLFALVIGLLAFSAFRQGGPTYFKLKVPPGWPEPRYDFSQNPLSEEGVSLGRHLFYDPILSRDSTVSCGTCHLSYSAFTHVDHGLSHGIEDRIGFRNSLALMNLAWQQHFMWDGAVHLLDAQALAPISDSTEMDEDIAHVVAKLQATDRYPDRFAATFGDSLITGERLLKSLAQFQLTLISSNSKYDQVMREEPGAFFTPQEKRGYDLFQTHCERCHQEPLFTNGQFANNGLPIDTFLNDIGRMRITDQPADSLMFKVPTLRNIDFSYPYMHDGRFAKLSHVLDHYQAGIQPSTTLDPALRKGIPLTAEDKADLIAFLKTLSDLTFTFNRDFAFPRS